MASLEAYECAIGEGAAPSPLPLYMEQQPSLQLSSRYTCCHGVNVIYSCKPENQYSNRFLQSSLQQGWSARKD